MASLSYHRSLACKVVGMWQKLLCTCPRAVELDHNAVLHVAAATDYINIPCCFFFDLSAAQDCMTGRVGSCWYVYIIV